MIWHVYIAIARREFDVASALRKLGGEAFVPHVVVPRVKNGRRYSETHPLVPKYVFAGFLVVPWDVFNDERIRKATSLKHLTGVVSIGDEPARMTRRDLEMARSMAEPPLAKIAPLRAGDKVKIKTGALAECAAIIVKMMENTAELDIAKAGRVTIKRDELEAA